MRKPYAMALLMLVAVLFAGPHVLAQAPDFGTISGLVTDQGTGDPIQHAMLASIYPSGPYRPAAQAVTDAAGNYEMQVPYGQFVVVAGAWGYQVEYWEEADNREAATPVVVDADNSPTGINFTLASGSCGDGSIAGAVYEFGTEVPIAEAILNLHKVGDYHFYRMVLSGEDGTYLFDNLPAGSYEISCGKEGYIPVEYPNEVVVDSNDVTGIDFYLEPLILGSIAGFVYDVDSLPLEDARVVARMNDPHPHGREAFTGADGSYIIDDLPPGEYTVHACKPEFFMQEYPDPVVVNGDDVTGINFYLEPITFGGISGVVTNAVTTEPIHRAIVIAIQTEFPHYHHWAFTNENGEYTIELISGTYQVQAWAWGYLRAETENPIVVEDEIVTGVDFGLNPIEFGSISGTVYNSDSIPVANAWVDARGDGHFFHSATRTDEDGNYTIDRLRPGSYTLRAFARNYLPEVLDDPVVVESDQDVTGIDFYLTPIGDQFDGYISGYVTDEDTDAPIADALVLALAPGWNHRRIIRRTITDENGYYIFENLPSLELKILCLAESYRPEFYDNKFSWWEADPVTPNADNINFALGVAEFGPRLASGTVIESGQPIDGAVVMAILDDEVVSMTVTYPDGKYYLDNLAPGDYTLEFISPSEAEGSIEVTVVFEDVFDADVILSPTIADDNNSLPQTTTLMQNYPNPFNATTNISFVLENSDEIELSVYDLLGRKVVTVASGNFEAGSHTFTWNGLDYSSNSVSSGIYLYVLKTADQSFTNRMLLLK